MTKYQIFCSQSCSCLTRYSLHMEAKNAYLFSDDRSECVVHGEVKDHYTVTRKTYKAYLNETEKIFVLNEGDYDSRILFWGKLSGNNKAKLNWYSGKELMSVDLTILTIE